MRYDEDYKATKIKITSDFPTSCSSTFNGANLDGFAFNIKFIAQRDPLLAVKIQENYKKAWALRNKQPLDNKHKDFIKASDRMMKLVGFKYCE